MQDDGFDLPEIDPDNPPHSTRSNEVYTQMVGRGEPRPIETQPEPKENHDGQE